MQRRIAALAVSKSVAAASLALAPAAQGAQALPQTGFERSRDGAGPLSATRGPSSRPSTPASDRVSVRELARTREGRPLRLVTIGAQARTDAQIAAGSSVLLLCSQHGNEPAGGRRA